MSCSGRRTGLCLAWTAFAIASVAVASLAAEPFDYFRNSWNVVGLKDYNRGTRVTPDNQLLLADGSLVQLRFGRELRPLSREQIKQLREGWLPIIELTADDTPVRYAFTIWATPLPTVNDWQKAFDGPTEGENFMNWVVVEATNAGAERAEAKFQAVKTAGQSASTLCDQTSAVAPGETATFIFAIPFEPVPGEPAKFTGKESDLWLARTVDYWKGLLSPACHIEVPCRKATEALRAAHVCQLIANDHGQLHGGEGFYDEFYIRDGGYQIMELEEAGLADAAARAVAYYLQSQRPDGRFETQSSQFDANGQAVWVLWQYFKITGDRPWLEKAYPQMVKAVDWVRKARREAPAGSPFAGVLPAAPADGEYLWDGKHHIVGYDLWNLRALFCTADAARILGKTAEAEVLLKEAALYREAIDGAWKRTGIAHFPPSWEKAGTHWGNTETLWPTAIFDRDDPRVAATIEHARRIHVGGFIEGTIQWLGASGAIHPYMSAYTTMASLERGEDEQVVEDFYWYLLHSTAAHAFPEGIFYKRRFAWSDTIPHVTGASNYALLLRHMLVHEQGDELHLLAAVPYGWLAAGQTIRIERAPTHFGVMDLCVRAARDGVHVELKAPRRQTPRRIVLHLPQDRPLEGAITGVDLAVRPKQQKSWDFATVVRLYQESAAATNKPIPGLATLPWNPPPAPERCRALDLGPVANTDPFHAPFGVPRPGKYLFTGLAIGRQVYGGIPFEILDPSKNKGGGMVVLHSPHAPQNVPWPREIEIPVGRQGKRLFFLGNVHGWDSQDAGAGPWGAVAQYVIHYRDGQMQVVPLVTGRTADEWAAPPQADEVLVGAQGAPWHLNVLGVTLRPVAVEKIVFRDLGTPAAPLLAAVTLEE